MVKVIKDKSRDITQTIIKSQSISTEEKEITDAEWAKIQSYMLKPQKFQKEDINAFEIYLANNAVDRDKERFPSTVLKSFKKSVPGMSLLLSHNKDDIGHGKFYNAKLIKFDRDAFQSLLKNNYNTDIEKQLDLIEEMDNGFYILKTSVYMFADHPKTRAIDAGIIRDASISFLVYDYVKVLDENDNILWHEFRNSDKKEAEALEGSLVYRGAQYGAEIKSNKNENNKTVINNKDTNKEENKMSETIKLKFNLPNLNIDKEIYVSKEETKSFEAACQIIEEKVQFLITEKDKLQSKLNDVAEVFGEDWKKESLQNFKKQIEDHKKEIAEKVVAIQIKSGMISENSAKVFSEMYQNLPIEQLKTVLSETKEEETETETQTNDTSNKGFEEEKKKTKINENDNSNIM